MDMDTDKDTDMVTEVAMASTGMATGAMGGMVEATRAPQGHGDARAIVGRAANRSHMKLEAVLGPRTRQNRRHQ